MDETDSGRGKRSSHKMENLSLETKTFSRDFLQGFLIANPIPTQLSKASASKEDDDTELNLGLSLGGRFGVDNTSSSKNNKLLVRSSSIAGPFPIVRDDDVLTPPPVSYQSLMRTSSLPVETEEEWRKRKDLQTLRRMAAKRRRSEKQRNLKNDCGGEADQLRLRSLVAPPQPPVRVPPLGRSSSGGGGGGGQVSMDQSQCGSSSGISEPEIRTAVQGSSGGEASPSILQPGGGSAARRKGKGGVNDDSLEEMPCVFTEGDGPNGKRVEGILYKYGRGEEVRIMCVCHGHFLSPSEFVKHAGGSDVSHPLKHIVVTSSSIP